MSSKGTKFLESQRGAEDRTRRMDPARRSMADQTRALPATIRQPRMFRGKTLRDETELVAICVALGAAGVGGPLSRAEARLVRRALNRSFEDQAVLDRIRQAVHSGEDPLGDEFCTLRGPEERRLHGAFYTGASIVSPMLAWVLDRDPTRIIDAGCGSGRFAVKARRMGFVGELVAVDADPVATLMARAHLAAAGVREARVIHGDFLHMRLKEWSGRTAFVGNPPYVRHHDLHPSTKRWAKLVGNKLALRVSGLAGLHALFVLAVAQMSRPGDVGCFITSAEWVDARYGTALRQLFAGPLGLVRLDMINPQSATFGDAMTTACIASWEAGFRGCVTVRRVQGPTHLGPLVGGSTLQRSQVAGAGPWSELFRPRPRTDGLVPLGSFAKVHRGVATGANGFFVLRREEAERLHLLCHVRPCLARATELMGLEGVVRANQLGNVLLDVQANKGINEGLKRYLEEGDRQGVPERYLCAHRKPWWRVGGSPPPPIVATYMARQAPVFAANPDRCQIINVFHGIHFREDVEDQLVWALVKWLNAHREELTGGRTYYGGLLKFEPGDFELLMVPPLERLAEWRQGDSAQAL